MTAKPLIELNCRACGAAPSPEQPFSCAQRGGDDRDHLIVSGLVGRPAWPEGLTRGNPYVTLRKRSFAYRLALEHGMSDGEFIETVEALDAAVEAVAGTGFRVTPLETARHASATVWAKDETGNVAGSHKARHLFGLLIYLTIAERVGCRAPGQPLAIASCGNAALAAATLAAAAKRHIRVFIPPTADASIVRQLTALGAVLTTCHRTEGEQGDPCYLAFRHALAGGAVPFSCQGPDNGLAIESGMTLGYEFVSQLLARGAAVDSLLLQVGGGAFASSIIAAFREAEMAGAVDKMPRIVAVQTEGAWPLRRAHQHMKARLEHVSLESCLSEALEHRSRFMWPWEDEPNSIASGILDDETYDWFAICRAVLETGGDVVTVGEPALKRARDWVEQGLGIEASYTGASGCAALGGDFGATVGVVVTGRRSDG